MARKYKWQIIKKDEAELLGISIAYPDEAGLLVVDMRSIPSGMCLEEFVDYIQDNGIVLKE